MGYVFSINVVFAEDWPESEANCLRIALRLHHVSGQFSNIIFDPPVLIWRHPARFPCLLVREALMFEKHMTLFPRSVS
jgi:hypothetical protein